LVMYLIQFPFIYAKTIKTKLNIFVIPVFKV